MGNLFAVDHLKRRDGLRVACLAEHLDHVRGDIQTPRLKHHGDNGKAAHQVIRGVFGGAPHAGMGGQGAVVAAKRFKAVAHQVEMLGLFIGGLHPVVIETGRHRLVGEAGDQIPVQIDGVEFDMRDGVQKGDPAFGAAGTAARHIARVKEGGQGRARGAWWRGGMADAQARARIACGKPCGGVAAAKRGLFPAVGGCQDSHGHLRQRQVHTAPLFLTGHSACAAASTSSAWPLTPTLFQTRATVPVPSIRKVVRSTPI